MVKGKKSEAVNRAAPAGGFYFLAYIGAVIYFIDRANGFWEVVLAFLQALVWPAFLIYNIFDALRV